MNIKNSNEIKVNELNENIMTVSTLLKSKQIKNNGMDSSSNKDELDNGAKNTNVINITPLNTQELLFKLIAKHKRLLDEYKSEFSILDEKKQRIDNDIDSANKNKEATLNRVEVLKEMPLQFYNQILNLLEELSELNGTNNKLLHSINDKVVKLTKPKYLLDIDETKQSIDEIKSLVSKLTVDAQGTELVSTILARLESVLGASVELNSIHGNDKKFDEDSKRQEIELKDIASRYGWLKNRIESHKKAFEYWSLKTKPNKETVDKGECI